MKKALLALAALVATVSIIHASPAQEHSVGTNSVMVLPPRGTQNATTWASGVLYTQGAVVINSNRYYWCQTAGGGTNTTADAPAYEADGRSANGTNVWQYILPGSRAVGKITNNGSASIYVTPGAAAVLNAGQPLNANGGAWNIEEAIANSAFYAICGSASNSVSTVDK